jgi:hypothetical protein
VHGSLVTFILPGPKIDRDRIAMSWSHVESTPRNARQKCTKEAACMDMHVYVSGIYEALQCQLRSDAYSSLRPGVDRTQMIIGDLDCGANSI